MIRPRNFADEDPGRIFSGVFVGMRTTTISELRQKARNITLNLGRRIDGTPLILRIAIPNLSATR
jgi:hypothetical protein